MLIGLWLGQKPTVRSTRAANVPSPHCAETKSPYCNSFRKSPESVLSERAEGILRRFAVHRSRVPACDEVLDREVALVVSVRVEIFEQHAVLCCHR